MVCENTVSGTYNGRAYIRLAGIDFYPDELRKELEKGKDYILCSRGVYKLSIIASELAYKFIAKRISSQKGITKGNRYFLVTESEAAIYKGKE